jgi:thiazole synthase
MDVFKIGNRIFKSRLIVGTGKYKDLQETADAVKASGADLVTVAVRRVNIIDTKEPLLMDYIDPEKITYLPNTAGCFTSEDALRTLRLAKESGGWNLVKLEVLGDEKTLYPNMQETIKAAKILVEEGFEVMVYCSDDPIACKILEKIGVVAVMPLGSLIGSGQGIPNKLNIEIIIKQSNIPVIVDAGIGTASDAVIAMELGCDAVLVNSAIAKAKKPLMMAESMKNAVIAGRQSYLSGRMDKINIASASSPINGKINN